ncbi:hypothetical protein [Clostridium sp. JNZ J1-5]
MKSKLSEKQKQLDTDIWIIALFTMAAFIIYMTFENEMMKYVKDITHPIILKLLVNAVVQFSIAGLGIVVVSLIRKESFFQFGLFKSGAFKSILGSTLCFIPSLIYIITSGQFVSYRPLSILISDEILQSRFPINVLGMAIIALVWGFFEGFNYVVISDKLNKRYPSNKKWINIGAITCALICILFHPFSTSFWGIIEIITTFILIYGMLIVKEKTGNAWGCVFVFCFLWNAF